MNPFVQLAPILCNGRTCIFIPLEPFSETDIFVWNTRLYQNFEMMGIMPRSQPIIMPYIMKFLRAVTDIWAWMDSQIDKWTHKTDYQIHHWSYMYTIISELGPVCYHLYKNIKDLFKLGFLSWLKCEDYIISVKSKRILVANFLDYGSAGLINTFRNLSQLSAPVNITSVASCLCWVQSCHRCIADSSNTDYGNCSPSQRWPWFLCLPSWSYRLCLQTREKWLWQLLI